MLKSKLAATAVGLCLAACLVTPSFAESYKEEMREHPRLVKAILQLEDAIAYLKAAPHDFGGHKANAIRNSEAALTQLREAIKYRAKRDKR